MLDECMGSSRAVLQSAACLSLKLYLYTSICPALNFHIMEHRSTHITVAKEKKINTAYNIYSIRPISQSMFKD